jgi:hypothetical protein
MRNSELLTVLRVELSAGGECMSGRLANTPRTNRRATGLVGAVVLGLLAAFGSGGRMAAQPQPTKLEDVEKGLKVDPNRPLPADAPHRRAPEDFAVPNTDRLMFAEIEDFKPVASEAESRLEYLAWCEVVTHARRFAAAELEQYAARDLTPLDLIKTQLGGPPNRPKPSPFRCELVRFDGRLICVRRLAAPLYFKDKEPSLAELYEARFVPVDESPLTPVSIVFLDRPEALSGALQKPPGEWTDAAQWVTAAGYYFKTIPVPGERANETTGVPVLIGRSVSLRSGPPGAGPELDQNVRVYRAVRDKTEIAGRPRLNDVESPWQEAAAYDRVVRHAARFTAEELERHARTDLKFADLFLDESGPGYRLDLATLEGRLISLRRFEPAAELQSAGVENMFEGWLVPADEPRGNPVCIVFTEPLAGVEPVGRVNKWVSFAGYSFKKMKYRSGEPDPKNPALNVYKYAPLLIGKSPVPHRDPDEPTTPSWAAFLDGALACGVVLIGAAGALTWYYRRGDRRARTEMDAVRGRNPFDPAEPGPGARVPN